MQTPTTTTRENSGAPAMICVDHAGHADALEDHRAAWASRRAPRPRARRATTARGRRRSFSIVPTRELERRRDVVEVAVVAGAPRTASPRRVDDDVGAARRRRARAGPARSRSRRRCARRCALSMQITAEADRAAADHDRDRAACLTSPRRTACQPTAIGSVSAASSGDSPFGTGNIERLLDDHLLGVGAGGGGRQADRVDRRRRGAAAAARRPACPAATLLRQPGPCSATSPQNSWPNTTSWSERMKPS